jgi:hypothetical protein
MSTKSSSGDTHPYLKGYRFWSANRFWLAPMYSPEAKAYYEEWLSDLRKNENQLTRLTAGK